METSNNDLQKHVSILERGLSQLGQGIILLSKLGKVVYSTNVANEMIARSDGLVIKDGGLVGVIEQDNVRLQHMCELVVTQSSEDQTYQNFYIHRNNEKKPYLLLISKISLVENAHQHDDEVLIIIKDTDANRAHWEERLKSNFGLTNRESYFVGLLAEGRNIKEIGLVMNIAEDTARQYLKSCFKKMGVNKQHELVCLALDSFRNR